MQMNDAVVILNRELFLNLQTYCILLTSTIQLLYLHVQRQKDDRVAAVLRCDLTAAAAMMRLLLLAAVYGCCCWSTANVCEQLQQHVICTFVVGLTSRIHYSLDRSLLLGAWLCVHAAVDRRTRAICNTIWRRLASKMRRRPHSFFVWSTSLRHRTRHWL